MSRKQTPFYGLDHIRKILEKLLEKLPDCTVLDGELFSSKIPFQTIVSLVRKQKLNDEIINIKLDSFA